jgi:transposase InsO family protein
VVVHKEIVRLKTAYPQFGIRRIAQWLGRVLLLPASPETVRKTLHRHQLLPKAKPQRSRNPPKPRFFERATPMQLWQSDICTIRLGGKQAYLIGFMDDHSRYLVGLELFSSQTSENVLEVYRRAVAEYGVPKEMLTDNGRQYATWWGKTRFQLELKKDGVHDILSQPHHPITLGKIERFWKTIWDEFLCRAQFDSFDTARERVRLWVRNIITTSDHTRRWTACARPIGSSASSSPCARRSSKASRKTSWSWRYGGNRSRPFIWWVGWANSRS